MSHSMIVTIDNKQKYDEAISLLSTNLRGTTLLSTSYPMVNPCIAKVVSISKLERIPDHVLNDMFEVLLSSVDGIELRGVNNSQDTKYEVFNTIVKLGVVLGYLNTPDLLVTHTSTGVGSEMVTTIVVMHRDSVVSVSDSSLFISNADKFDESTVSNLIVMRDLLVSSIKMTINSLLNIESSEDTLEYSVALKNLNMEYPMVHDPIIV